MEPLTCHSNKLIDLFDGLNKLSNHIKYLIVNIIVLTSSHLLSVCGCRMSYHFCSHTFFGLSISCFLSVKKCTEEKKNKSNSIAEPNTLTDDVANVIVKTASLFYSSPDRTV